MKLPSPRPWLALLPFFATVAFSYGTGEFYPFSQFPMYSKFEDRTYYVYLVDGEGKEVPSLDFKIFASELKKQYGDHLGDLKKTHKGSHFDWSPEQKAPAARATLDYLREKRAPKAFAEGKHDALTLVDARIFWKDGEIITEVAPIASLKEGPLPTPDRTEVFGEPEAQP